MLKFNNKDKVCRYGKMIRRRDTSNLNVINFRTKIKIRRLLIIRRGNNMRVPVKSMLLKTTIVTKSF